MRVWKEWQNEMDDQGNQEAIHPTGRVRGSEERCNCNDQHEQYDQSGEDGAIG